MVQHSPFTSKEDPNLHLQAFIQLLSGTALGVPLNKLGNPRLKPATSQSRARLTLAHRAWPMPWWPRRLTKAAHSKSPSSGLRLARGRTPPSGGLRPVRGGALTSSRLRLARGSAPPLSGLRPARGHSAHARLLPYAAFNALTIAGRRHHAPGARSPVPSHHLPRREPIPATVRDCVAWPVPVP
jgi:hypothetical protein